jgi:enamine deaminase RidA (YjgF/YER057c/UK114 family)
MPPIQPQGWKRGSGFSHGMSASGHLLVTAGQVGWDPATERFVSDEFAEQTEQALENIVALLVAARARPEHIVRLTWYVTSRTEYLEARQAIGESYRRIMGMHFPAMTVVVVNALLETRAKVEIEATAVIPG